MIENISSLIDYISKLPVADIITGIDLEEILTEKYGGNIEIFLESRNPSVEGLENCNYLGQRKLYYNKSTKEVKMEIITDDTRNAKEILALSCMENRPFEDKTRKRVFRFNEKIFRKTPLIDKRMKFDFIVDEKNKDLFVSYPFVNTKGKIEEIPFSMIQLSQLLIPMTVDGDILFIDDMDDELKEYLKLSIFDCAINSNGETDELISTNIRAKTISYIFMINSFWTAIAIYFSVFNRSTTN